MPQAIIDNKREHDIRMQIRGVGFAGVEGSDEVGNGRLIQVAEPSEWLQHGYSSKKGRKDISPGTTGAEDVRPRNGGRVDDWHGEHRITSWSRRESEGQLTRVNSETSEGAGNPKI